MAEWFECVCQFLRHQSQNLAGVMNGLSNQNTISDIDTGNPDSISNHLNSNGGNGAGVGGMLNQVTPMQVFMVILAMVYTYMYLFTQARVEPVKPRNNAVEEDAKRDGRGDDEGNGGGMA